MPGPSIRPIFSVSPAANSMAAPHDTVSPFFSTSTSAPVIATVAAALNRKVGPLIVISNAAIPSEFPTRRFANRNDKESKGPQGGTPTSHNPVRPGQSWTVVMVPADNTSKVFGR
jgi:hypothetical protein